MLDPDRRELSRGTELVAVEPQVFDLLVYLIGNRERVVSKDDLLASIWQGRIVSESALNTRISAARLAIGDNGEDQRLIKTLPRKGIRFVGSVKEEKPFRGAAGDQCEALTVPQSAARSAGTVGFGSTSSYDSEVISGKQSIAAHLQESRDLPLPALPSIAVLPFSNFGADAQQEYVSDGLVEDIITELSRFRELFVIARNSSFKYKGKAVDLRQVGRELGVRYVLEGSLRRSGNRIRVAVQLIDAESGGHVWADRYEHEFADVFALQDSITRSVVGALQPQILIGESCRASRKSPPDLDAFDCCMRGMWHHYRGTPYDSRQAQSWLRRAIELDPTLTRAHMLLGRVLIVRCWAGYSDDIDHDLQASLASAERALFLDNRDADCHYVLALTALTKRRHQQALVAAQQSIRLNPNFALGYFALGETLVFGGQFTDALDPLARCLRLSPVDPFAHGFEYMSALAYYHLCKYEQAAKHVQRALQSRVTHLGLRTAAAILGQLGRTDEARSVVLELKRSQPADPRLHWEITCPYADPAHEEHLRDGLGKAGLVLT